jgi:hypothetical protein
MAGDEVDELWLKAGYGTASRPPEHGEQSLHQGHCTGYANAVDDGHFPIFVPLGVEESRHDHYAAGDYFYFLCFDFDF